VCLCVREWPYSTVTKPSEETREAMARAEVGDDVYVENPNVNRLQECAAEMW